MNPVLGWHVNPTHTLSDHRYIRFSISALEESTVKDSIVFDFKHADWSKFNSLLRASPALRLPVTPHELESAIKEEMRLIQQASYDCIPMRNTRSSRNLWWNDRLTQLKRKVNENRKIVERNKQAHPEIIKQMKISLEYTLNKYGKEIRKAKRKSFRRFCLEVNPKNFCIEIKVTTSGNVNQMTRRSMR